MSEQFDQEQVERLASALELTAPTWATFCKECKAECERGPLSHNGWHIAPEYYMCPNCGKLTRGWQLYDEEVERAIDFLKPEGSARLRAALRGHGLAVALFDEGADMHCKITDWYDDKLAKYDYDPVRAIEANEESATLRAALWALERGWIIEREEVEE